MRARQKKTKPAAKKATKPRRRPPTADKATPAIVEQRVQSVLQIRLDGAEGWDVRQYVAQQEEAGVQPWKVGPGGKSLSERAIREYVTRADALIAESCRVSRQEQIRRHKAQRRSLYARAVQSGDIRTALAVLDSLATLGDLFPAKRVKNEHSGSVKTRLEIVEELVDASDCAASRDQDDSPAPRAD